MSFYENYPIQGNLSSKSGLTKCCLHRDCVLLSLLLLFRSRARSAKATGSNPLKLSQNLCCRQKLMQLNFFRKIKISVLAKNFNVLKSCSVLLKNRALWAPSGGIISKLGLKVHTNTLEWAFWHKNNDNGFGGRGLTAFQWQGMFLALFISKSAQS